VSGLLDSEGRFIARSVGQAQAAGQLAPPALVAAAQSDRAAGKAAYRSGQGAMLATFHQKVPGTGWTVVVTAPARGPLPFGRHHAWLFGGGLVASCLTALIGIRLGRCLRGEAATLTHAAQALGRREPVRIDGIQLRDFAVVGEALQQAGAALRDREDALRASEERYRGLVESQLDLVMRFGAGGAFTFVNETVCRVLGRPRGDLLGRSWREVIHPDDIAIAAEAIGRAMASPDHRAAVTCRLLTDTGPRWFAWEGVALVDETGSADELQAVGRDVTEQIAAEAELKAAKAAAEAATLAKSKFLAAASHDLRQPFQAMRLFYEVLYRQLDVPRRAIADKLEEAMGAGEQLLTALLDVSTLDAGTVRVTIDTFPASEVILAVAAECEPQASAAGLRLRWVPSAALVRSDRVLLTRMVRNLVLNAIRYTREGAVLVGCRRHGGEVRIEIWDTGIGIPEDQLDLIFDDFYQVGNKSRDRAKGLGLGLSVVARTGRLLGHGIGVRSRVGGGSCFSIALPGVCARAPRETREFIPAEKSPAG
jgi:PAS domain S-box-containing protein